MRLVAVALAAGLLLSSGRSRADAVPYPGYRPPPCPVGSERRSAGAGRSYCRPLEACLPGNRCLGDKELCRSAALCVQVVTMAGGESHEWESVGPEKGDRCPEQTRLVRRNLCFPPAGPVPSSAPVDAPDPLPPAAPSAPAPATAPVPAPSPAAAPSPANAAAPPAPPPPKPAVHKPAAAPPPVGARPGAGGCRLVALPGNTLGGVLAVAMLLACWRIRRAARRG
ncbi:MAG: hypothetical protein HY744_10985 [Deltaproteobacteria bacterium]|nr:hypothetical protein [Deltaproteobacteria bacterium]